MAPSLLDLIRTTDPSSAARQLGELDDREIVDLLRQMHPGFALAILDEFEALRRDRICAVAPVELAQQWRHDHHFEQGTVGRLMEVPNAVFRADTLVGEVIETLREVVKNTFVIYVFVTDAEGHLVGVVAFRELLFAGREQYLHSVMVRQPFCLRPDTPVLDAMREVVTRHYPAYPVCDHQGRLLGSVRGNVLFEQQTFEISAQAGAMVGVEREERISTPWPQSFRFRHPWLQLNLLTAFLAAAVVGWFQDAINQIVLLAVFLPVLAGQSSNTGCQTLAITLRGMTLGELRPEQVGRVVLKESWLGFWNGLLVGLVAAVAMFAMASVQNHPQALGLALITLLAMAASCLMSGLAGTLIPLGMRRLGADPASASGIFLSTATDVVSMAVFLGLASAFVL